MKKYPYYIFESVVENENWEEYSLNILQDVKESTLKYYEEKYNISGMVRDLIRYCSERKYITNFTYRYPSLIVDDIQVYCINTYYIKFNEKIVYQELEKLVPGDWLDKFFEIYEQNLPKINECKEKIEKANKKQYIENYFN